MGLLHTQLKDFCNGQTTISKPLSASKNEMIRPTNVSSTLWGYCGSPSLAEGNAKGLKYLHDVVNQHLQALKGIDYDPS